MRRFFVNRVKPRNRYLNVEAGVQKVKKVKISRRGQLASQPPSTPSQPAKLAKPDSRPAQPGSKPASQDNQPVIGKV